jgi:FAD:protein FMN transferase
MQLGEWTFQRAAVIAAVLFKLHPAAAIAQGAAQEYRQLHLGVEVRLVLATADRAAAAAGARAAYAAIAELEQVLSDWRPTSEVRQLALHPGEWVPVSPALFDVTAASLRVAQASDGAFDPTVGPVVALWREARRTGTLPSDSALQRTRGQSGWTQVHLDRATHSVRLDLPGMRLDFGGIAKGYILDSARSVLRRRGITAVLLEAGGDVMLGDPPPGERGWRVVVATAHGDTTLLLANVGVGTSGPSAQFVDIGGVRYSHVIDPRSGRALTRATQATVIHTTGAMSDALSTMVTVLGETAGSAIARALGASAVFVHDAPIR